MVHLNLVSAFLLFIEGDSYLFTRQKEELFENEKICNKVLERPNFDNDFVIGIPWRVYYTWNAVTDRSCRDMAFKKTSALMVNHIRSKMHRYMQTQPIWADASLFLTMSRYRHVLLVSDPSNIPGSFVQVPLILETQFTTYPSDKQIPLYDMALKLVLHNQYLILSDCSSGVTFLLGHRTSSPVWGEIRTIVLSSNFGEGVPSCARS